MQCLFLLFAVCLPQRSSKLSPQGCHHESTLPLQVTESPGKSTLEHCAKFTLIFQFKNHMVEETVTRVH